MSEQDNRQLVERALAAANQHDLDAYVASLDDSFVWNNDFFPGPLFGRAAVRQALASLFSAFPDFHIEIQEIFTSGDHVITRVLTSGTHKGEFNGIAATNRQVQTRGCNVSQIRNGRIVKSDSYGDRLALMQQLGLSLAKGTAANL